jgi:Family of unknown function (DUF5683)
MFRFFLIVLWMFCLGFKGNAQTKPVGDTSVKPAVPTTVSAKKKRLRLFKAPDSTQPYSPRLATIRSAVLPGWGQITNKKYWKLPLVWGAIGVTSGLFLYNLKTFREARDAYINATDGIAANDFLIPEPYFSVISSPERIRSFRNQIRQNVDYSALFILIFWGLNVVDASVDAHLKQFDVGNDLSLRIQSGYSPLAQTHGISIVLKVK